MRRDRQLPTLAELIDNRLAISMAAMNKISIGTIQAFDATNQTATITINYKRILKDAAMAENNIDTIDRVVDYPMLVKVPVVVLSGGVSRLTLPIAAGDTCLLFFCDREIDTWFMTGVVTFPQSERIHSLTDAVALVGIRSTQNALSSFNSLLASIVDRTGERLAQAGMIMDFAGFTAPSGWLMCYGQAVSRTTYADLFAVIGTTYGTGDGSTTFTLPDLRGRGTRGLDNMGGTNANRLTTTYTPNRNTLGGGVGEEAHQLTIPELPKHTHDGLYYGSQLCVLSSGGSNRNMADNGSNGGSDGFKTAIAGNDQKHNNVPPDMMTNKIIKY